MKIVNLTTTDFGGAYKAVERIQESLRTCGMESTVLVRSRYFDSETHEVMDSALKRLMSKSRNFLNLLLSRGEVITDYFGADLTHIPEIQRADVIMLHWVNSFVSSKSILKLAETKKPIIWVMHDMWTFTGGCHYDAYCGKYENGCGACPYIKGRKERDISYWNVNRKGKLYEKTNIYFIAISRWERNCALNSKLLQKQRIEWIPNPLNIDVFCPLDRYALKQKYRLREKKVVLFGADKALENTTKGFQYLVEALQYLDGTKYMAVCFGKAPEKKKISLENMEIRYLGVIREEKKLAEWYNVADVFVAPSLQEGFGYTVCEALSCGTPVTAFCVGGMLDQIKHKENGYLARLYDSQNLAEGISFCVNNREKLGRRARTKVVTENNYKIIGDKYKKLFDEILTCNGK